MLDECFLFLMYLALGSTEVDLADRFGVHPSTVSRIITTWTYYLYFLLGSLTIWLSPEQVQAVLPKEFRQSKYADTQVNISTKHTLESITWILLKLHKSNCHLLW